MCAGSANAMLCTAVPCWKGSFPFHVAVSVMAVCYSSGDAELRKCNIVAGVRSALIIGGPPFLRDEGNCDTRPGYRIS